MKDKINLWTPNDPDGYGAFDEEQLYERAEDAMYEKLSECCSAPIILHDICSFCGEHI